MRTLLTITAFLAFSSANAIAGAILFSEITGTLVGQYVAVIAFLAGVAGVLAKIVQSLYQKIIDDKEARIVELQKRLAEIEVREKSQDD